MTADSLLLSQTPVLLTPSPLPSTIHFWSTLSPIAPRSPAKLSFQVGLPVSCLRCIPCCPALRHLFRLTPSSESERESVSV